LNQISTEASTLLANYVNSNTYPSQNSADARNFVIALTRNGEWFPFQSIETQTGILNYVISNKFSDSSTNFANQMIALAIANNSTFSFDNTLNSTNAMSFNSVTDFQKMLNDMEVIPANIAYDPGNGQVTANVKFQLTPFGGGVKIRILENVGPPRTIAEVTSITYGISLGFSWTQTGTASITPSGNTTTIVVDGILAYNSIFASIGIFNEMERSYQIVINNTDGTIISAIKLR
jgi:hypothetical protein